MILTLLVLTMPTATAVAVGAAVAWRHRAEQPLEAQSREDKAGWIYFAGGAEGPIKIGMTSHEPSQERLPELRTMSPIPLKLIYKLWVPERYEAEAALHELLKDYRQHGEWFDRDATLYYIDHLKGTL